MTFSGPQTQSNWLKFLHDTIPLVSSYKRLTGIVGTVCYVPARYWTTKFGCTQQQVDPRLLYALEHRLTMRGLQRHAGVGLNQVEAITMKPEMLHAMLMLSLCVA